MEIVAAAVEMPFVPSFDPQHAQWRSTQQRVEIFEALFKAMKVKPWRTYKQAGLD